MLGDKSQNRECGYDEYSMHSCTRNGEPQEAYSLGGATGEEVVYIVY